MQGEKIKLFPLNSAELLDKAVDVYRRSFLLQIAYSTIVGVSAFILIGILSVAAIIFSTVALLSGTGLSFVVILAIMFVPIILIWVSLTSAGNIMLARQAYFGEKVWFRFAGVVRAVGRIISALIAQALMVTPFLLVGGLIIYATVQNADSSVVGWIAMFTLVLLAIGFWIFTNIFYLSVAVAVCERRIFFGTIKRSWAIVKNNFWTVLGVRTIWALVVMAITYSAQGAITVFGILFDQLGTLNPGMIAIQTLISIAFGLFSIAVSIAVMPLDGIMQASIYFNQRIRTEGIDILYEIEGLKK